MCGSHWHFLQGMYGGCHRLPSAAQQGGRTCNNSSVPTVPKVRLRQRPGYTGR